MKGEKRAENIKFGDKKISVNVTVVTVDELTRRGPGVPAKSTQSREPSGNKITVVTTREVRDPEKEAGKELLTAGRHGRVSGLFSKVWSFWEKI